MSDLTILIPYQHTKSREAGLQRVLEHLKVATPDAIVIVGDMGNDGRIACLNKMAHQVKTAYACNHDADIIAPAEMYREGLNLLKCGWDMVIPHSGTVMQDGKIRRDNDPGAVVMHSLVAWKIAGLENRLFRGWGFEDFERVVRAVGLGQRVYFNPRNRTWLSDGYTKSKKIIPFFDIEHIRHDKMSNPHALDNKKELLKIRKLNREELVDYVEKYLY